MVQTFEQYYEENHERFFKELRQLIRFPSISSNPDYHGQVKQCGRWLIEHFKKIGFTSHFIETPHLPIVFAERAGNPDAPTVLLYGHFDVQPEGDEEEWNTPPFDPHMGKNRIYGRGARDNKGQTFFWIKAFEALEAINGFDCTIKVLLDSAEESGSPGLRAVIDDLQPKLLKADVIVASETPGCDNGDPAIVVGLRGALHAHVRVKGADRELHSGNHGGIVVNPIIELSRALGSFIGSDGLVAVPGFYDGVEDPTPLERRLSARLPFDTQLFHTESGVNTIRTDSGFTPIEQIGFRPSIDVHGITGGSGPGEFKTSIPNVAEASFSSRIVPGQNPEKTLDSLISFIEEQLSPGLAFEVVSKSVVSPPFRGDLKSPVYKFANVSLENIVNHEMYYVWGGASLPVVPELIRVSGGSPLLVGFGLPDDNEHSVNESFSIEQWRKGFLFASRFMRNISKVRKDYFVDQANHELPLTAEA